MGADSKGRQYLVLSCEARWIVTRAVSGRPVLGEDLLSLVVSNGKVTALADTRR
jgi:hypothetical protein